MEVLEDEHERPLLGDRLEEAPPGREALALRHGLVLGREPDEAPQTGGHPVGFALVRGHLAYRSVSSSRSRPTSGDRASARSTPYRERASTASQTATGADFPFASTDSASRYSITWLVARYVVSPTRIPFTGAADCSRAAVLTTSPEAIPSPSEGRAPSAISASPVF